MIKSSTHDWFYKDLTCECVCVCGVSVQVYWLQSLCFSALCNDKVPGGVWHNTDSIRVLHLRTWCVGNILISSGEQQVDVIWLRTMAHFLSNKKSRTSVPMCLYPAVASSHLWSYNTPGKCSFWMLRNYLHALFFSSVWGAEMAVSSFNRRQWASQSLRVTAKELSIVGPQGKNSAIAERFSKYVLVCVFDPALIYALFSFHPPEQTCSNFIFHFRHCCLFSFSSGRNVQICSRQSGVFSDVSTYDASSINKQRIVLVSKLVLN